MCAARQRRTEVVCMRVAGAEAGRERTRKQIEGSRDILPEGGS